MDTYTVNYLDREGKPSSIRILAESQEHAVEIIGRWETPFTNIQAHRCQEVDHVK